MSHKQAFSDFSGFFIDSIEESDTGPAPSSIDFDWPNPAIGTDTGSSFVTHEVIGGAMVRQRISDKPVEASITGVCRESTAQQLVQLRNAKYGTIYSSQFPNGSLTVQFASISTSPMEDGGAVEIGDSEFLYTYDLECVEVLTTDGVINTNESSATGPGPDIGGGGGGEIEEFE